MRRNLIGNFLHIMGVDAIQTASTAGSSPSFGASPLKTYGSGDHWDSAFDVVGRTP
jgi:hypothetical protein